MATLAVSDLVFSNLLTELGMNPWWEKWRGFCCAGSAACALFVFYFTISGIPISCLPTNSTWLEDYKSPQADFVKTYCNDSIPWKIRLSGTVLLGSVLVILFFSTYWLHRPKTIDTFTSFHSIHKSIESLGITFDEMKYALLRSFDASTNDENSNKMSEICSRLCKNFPAHNTSSEYSKRSYILIGLIVFIGILICIGLVFILIEETSFACNLRNTVIPSQFGLSTEYNCVHRAKAVVVSSLIAFIVTLAFQICFTYRGVKMATKVNTKEMKDGRKEKVDDHRVRDAKFALLLWTAARPCESNAVQKIINYIFSDRFSKNMRVRFAKNITIQSNRSVTIYRALRDDISDLFAEANWSATKTPKFHYTLAECEKCLENSTKNRQWSLVTYLIASSDDAQENNIEEMKKVVEKLGLCFDLLDDSDKSILSYVHDSESSPLQCQPILEHLINFSPKQTPYVHYKDWKLNGQTLKISYVLKEFDIPEQGDSAETLPVTDLVKAKTWKQYFSVLLESAKKEEFQDMKRDLKRIKFNQWTKQVLDLVEILVSKHLWEEFKQLLHSFTVTEKSKLLKCQGHLIEGHIIISNIEKYSADSYLDLSEANALVTLLKSNSKSVLHKVITFSIAKVELENIYERNTLQSELFCEGWILSFCKDFLDKWRSKKYTSNCNLSTEILSKKYKLEDVYFFVKCTKALRWWKLFLLLISRATDLESNERLIKDLKINFNELGNSNDKESGTASILYFAFAKETDEKIIRTVKWLVKYTFPLPQMLYVHHDAYHSFNARAYITQYHEEARFTDVLEYILDKSEECESTHQLDEIFTELCSNIRLRHEEMKDSQTSIRDRLEKLQTKFSTWTEDAVSLVIALMKHHRWSELKILFKYFIVMDSELELKRYHEIELFDYIDSRSDLIHETERFVIAAIKFAVAAGKKHRESEISGILQASIHWFAENSTQYFPPVGFPKELVSSFLSRSLRRAVKPPFLFVKKPAIEFEKFDPEGSLNAIVQVCAYAVIISRKRNALVGCEHKKIVKSLSDPLSKTFEEEGKREAVRDHMASVAAYVSKTFLTVPLDYYSNEDFKNTLYESFHLTTEISYKRCLKCSSRSGCSSYLSLIEMDDTWDECVKDLLGKLQNCESCGPSKKITCQCLEAPDLLCIQSGGNVKIDELITLYENSSPVTYRLIAIVRNINFQYVAYLVGHHDLSLIKCWKDTIEMVPRSENLRPKVESDLGDPPYCLLFYFKTPEESNTKSETPSREIPRYSEKQNTASNCLLPPGMKNLGHSCWLNSVVQAFSYVLRVLGSVDLKVNEKDSSLLKLIKVMTQWEAKSVADQRLLSDALDFACNSNEFIRGDQQDCVEFYQKTEQAGMFKGLGITTELNLSYLTCEASKPPLIYSVICLQHDVAAVQNGVTSWMKTTIDKEKVNLKTAPDLFVVQLSRIEDERKTHQAIDLNYELILKTEDGDDNLYGLTAVIIHEGQGFKSGHYIAYLMESHDIVIKCDDLKVEPIEQNTEINNIHQEAYMLFYRRKEMTSDGIEDEGHKNSETQETNEDFERNRETENFHKTKSAYESRNQSSIQECSVDNRVRTENHDETKKNSSQTGDVELLPLKTNKMSESRSQCSPSRNDVYPEFTVEDEKRNDISRPLLPNNRIKQKSNKKISSLMQWR